MNAPQLDFPFFEDVYDAMREAVRALGGAKKVGAKLWPDKGIDAASRLLQDCLNPGRSEKLDPNQVMWLMREARNEGVVTPFQWYAHECGFDARPIQRKEEIDRCASIVADSTKALTAALAKLERLQSSL